MVAGKRVAGSAMRRVALVVAGILTVVCAANPTVAAAARTKAPALDHHRYTVRSGRVLTVRLNPHIASKAPETCELRASRDSATRAIRLPRVMSVQVLTLAVARHAPRGRWQLAARCRATGHRFSRSAHARLVVTGHGRGHGPLLGPDGVHIDGRQLDTGNSGYGGTAYPSAEAVGFAAGQCTHLAYSKRPDIYWNSVNAGAPRGGWDAYKWAIYAAQYGHFAEGSQPLVGAIMVQPAHDGGVGHVAYVSAVADNNHFTTQEENTDGRERANVVFNVANDRNPSSSHTAFYAADGGVRRHIGSDTVFIYGGPVITPPQYAGYLGHIVQWDGDRKAQKTAWLVINDGGRLRRRWIPDIPTYWCLKNAGAPGPDVLSSTVLDAMADETNVPATCSGDSTPGGGGGGGAVTYSELEGHHGSNTFTDVIHAAGLGPAIAAGQQVQVSCKVYSPQIASVNPDGFWYRIASDPWNNSYYAPANTFMNGDPWNGPYSHNTDFSVPTCADGAPGPGPTPTAAPSPAPTAAPTPAPPRTWRETAGGVAHTWTNYTNAGGNQGPSIGAGQTVDISCRLNGFRVADGNTWWYRIATSPWNNNYYVSADAFYNNGQTSGSLQGTPFVDSNVATC